MAEFNDPRLVAIYDTVNTHAAHAQPRFCATVAAEIGARSIVDLGCGTGLITCALAQQGYRMTGVDPSAAMLDVARRRAHGDEVHWICGSADDIGTPSADLAIMTSHVAQFFVSDREWNAALVGLHTALRPGGRLAFESRNPGGREWERWTRAAMVTVEDASAGRIETWTQVHDMHDGVASFTNHYRFAATGDELVSHAQLRFRTREELTASLADADFAIDRIHGDWDLNPADATSPEHIVVATRGDS